MSVQALPLEAVYTTSQHIYAVIRGNGGQVWNPTLNTGAGGWEAYNSAHWAQYAIAMTEQSGSGYYSATYPAGISGAVTSESYYNNVSPTLGDAPITTVQYSQGRNAIAVAADPVAASNMQKAAGAMVVGLALAGTTAQVIVTNLTTAQAAAAVGGSLIFAANATGAPQCAGRVISATGATLTLAAPLPVVPAVNDPFVVS